MVQLDERHARGWDVLRLSTDALTVEIIPGLGGTMTSVTRRADGAALLWSPPWGLRPRGSRSLPGTPAIQRALLRARPGDILLTHDGGGNRAQTVAALKAVLPQLQAEGLRFRVL